MSTKNQNSTTETPSSQGGVISRFLSLDGKRKIKFGRTDPGILSPRVRAMLSDSLMSKILIGKIMDAKKRTLNFVKS